MRPLFLSSSKTFLSTLKENPTLSNSSQFSLAIDPGNQSTSFHMFLRFIHVIVCISTSFLFLWLINIPLYQVRINILARWTWVSASSKSWWWTGKPGMLQSMRSQKVRHYWVNWIFHCMAIWDFFFPPHISIDGLMGWFHLLGIVNSADMNNYVQIFEYFKLFWVYI